MESTSRDRDDDVEVDAGEKREVCTCWVGDVFDGFMFKNEKFAVIHPGGAVGKRLNNK